ncbi:uncharacterized protein [Diabrotica undecimpunctata]|uniref:uncharacterized protein n=1 Tax=Diabrotica undecimpunctata TaxID=50387 RepID=UPI003B6391CC
MVKTFLGLLAASICGLVYAAPLADSCNNLTPFRTDSTTPTSSEESLLEDPAARNERSTNLSHVTGTARKIQMFIKNRHLQILPDGTVNGTTDDTSAYSILQRTTVGIGQMKIQGVVTCQYLCMARCGLLYGSREFGQECVFNETIEQSNYNTYSSSKYSNEKRTLYLALNQRGQSRKVVLRARKPLGRLSSYTLVLTRNVAPELHPIRHQGHVCLPIPHPNQTTHPSHQRCPKRRKRKKKRKCTKDENDPKICQRILKVVKQKPHNTRNVRKCNNEKDSELCQRNMNIRRKQTNLNKLTTEKSLVSDSRKKRKMRKGVRKRTSPIETTTIPVTAVPTTTTLPTEYTTNDEDYVSDGYTQEDWEASTAPSDINGCLQR